jgi:ABC-type multidrug transport system fused ATPase/permease subunit
MKDLYSNIVSFQQDSFQNITVIKAFGVTDWFGGRMENIQQEYKNKFLDYNNFSVKTSAVVSLLSLVCYFGCFGWGVYRLWMGRISYGEMTMFLQLAGLMGAAFSGITALVPSAISIATSAGRVMAVVELPQEDTLAGQGFDRWNSYSQVIKNYK